ncbi:hypothetical protein ACFQ0T_31310 [Kitasatospora gansuensis]
MFVKICGLSTAQDVAAAIAAGADAIGFVLTESPRRIERRPPGGWPSRCRPGC